MKKILKILNAPFKNTEWYRSAYGDVVKLKRQNTFNLELVALGSSSPRFGLDFSESQIKAENWAMQPQNLTTSFSILKNYHSYIREDGVVLLLLLCPFSALVGDFQPSFYRRYHYCLSPVLLGKYYSVQTYKKVQKEVECPLFFCAKPIIKSWIKKIIRIGKKTDAKTDAKKRIESWKKEFQIHSLTEPLSQKNKIAIEHKIEELCDIIDFCKERSLRPVLGIMPVTKVLRDAIPEEFIQTVFYDMVQEVQKKREVPVLDYYRSSEFLDSDLYSDSFLMNEKGRKVFTEKVLEDLFGIPK